MSLEYYKSLRDYLEDEIQIIDDEMKKLNTKRKELQKKLNDSLDLIVEASKFDTYSISENIRYLMSEIEDKNISCVKTTLPENFGIFSGNNIIVGDASVLFIKNSNRAEVLEPDKTIILSSTNNDPFPNQIQFLEAVLCDIQPAIYLDGFPYVKDFVEGLIEYRLMNNVKKLDFDEIRDMATNYIENYKNANKKTL